MTTTGMVNRIVSAALLIGLTGSVEGAQEPVPVYRSEVQTVLVEFSMGRRMFGIINRPYRGLKAAEVSIVLEDQTLAVVQLQETKPGHYLANFTPPDAYRDGKPHEIVLRIRKGAGLKLTVTIPKS